ncbi:hypothetical protein KJ644_01350 [Candidatus Dependentiae bacterium]|nr:hypothetical protein [Candidatus Dependentiae bacterium]MBU4387097.1 hypothetical protein [Candidatus Dependentiae bacterium]MCG2756521.1 hypothetical protein [Candidatus Dependentiae bacterium]
MKKLILSILGSLFFLSVQPLGILGQDPAVLMKYIGYIGAIDKALKGEPAGFSDLIKMATVEIQNLDFSKITMSQVEVIKNFIKDGLASKDYGISSQMKEFVDSFIAKLKDSASQNPVLINGLIQQISTLVGSTRPVQLNM